MSTTALKAVQAQFAIDWETPRAEPPAIPPDTFTCPGCQLETGMLISVDEDPYRCPACREVA